MRVTEEVNALREAAASATTSPESLVALAQNADERVRKGIASNPKTPVGLLRTLVLDDRHMVRVAVLDHPDAPAEVFHVLAASDEWLSRHAVAENERTPRAVLENLAMDNHDFVRRAVIANPSTPLEAWEAFMNDQADDVKIDAAMHPRVEGDLLTRLARHGGMHARFGVVQNPNVTPDLLEHLAFHGESNVRASVASHPKTPVAVLDALARRDVIEHGVPSYLVDGVPRLVAENPSTSRETLEALLRSPDRYGREAAKQALRERYGDNGEARTNLAIDMSPEPGAKLAWSHAPGQRKGASLRPSWYTEHSTSERMLYSPTEAEVQHRIDIIKRYAYPILDEWRNNVLFRRYTDVPEPDLRRRIAGNELLTDVLVDVIHDLDYSSFVSQFAEASIGGPSPLRTQLELLQHPRRTVRKAATPSLLADQDATRTRLMELYDASTSNLAVLRVLAGPEMLRDLRSLFTHVAPRSWFGAYAAAALAENATHGPPSLLPEPLAPTTSSATPAGNSGGCYVATAVYGSYDCPEVWVLRRWRDVRLNATPAGRGLVRAYYATSPAFVRAVRGHRWFTSWTRRQLDALVQHLRAAGYSDAPYIDMSV